MNHKPLFYFLLFLLGIAGLQAQPSGKLEFVTLSHSFGDLSESAAPVSFTFYFKNAGRSSIRLTRVTPSCKCTVPVWPNEPIAVGASGTIQVQFDPKGEEPGEFTKHVTVNTDGEPQAVLLKLTGRILGKPKPKVKPKVDITTFYKKKSGSLLLSSDFLSFGDVPKGTKASGKVAFYNPSANPINIDLMATKLPLHIALEASALTVQPKDSVVLSFTFDEVKLKDWGYVHSSVFVATDDAEEPRKRLDLSARIIEDFSKLEEDAPLPVATLNKSKHDFGSLTQHTTVATSFILKNIGKSTLHIRKTKASCGCTVGKPEKSILAPGEATTVEVVYRTGAAVGYQSKSVTIITNDPDRAEMVIWISANILGSDKKED